MTTTEGVSYKAIEIEKWGASFKVVDKFFRDLQPDEFLVKIWCTTILPADMTFIYGNYGRNLNKIFPLTPGFEAAGEIIKAADFTMTEYIGRRVGIFLDQSYSTVYHGLWAQYAYVKLENCIFYGNETTWDKIVFNINPLICCGLVDTCKTKSVDSIILDGAASDLGLMFNRLCQRENLKVFNLIRNKDEEQDLRTVGAPYILDMQKSDWEKDVMLIGNEFKPKICFDCVGGDTTSSLFRCLPPDSTLYNLGNLSEKAISNISSRDLIFYNKKLKGWWLPTWMNKKTPDEIRFWKDLIVTIKESNINIFDTKIAETYNNFDDFTKAWKAYSGDMNKGKVLIYPH